MDDSYPFPPRGHIMGKGKIITVSIDEAVIQGYSKVVILPQETMGDARMDLRRLFRLEDEVVYKADRDPVTLKRFICTYVRKVGDCDQGVARITYLEPGFGRACDPTNPNMKFFFTAHAYGDQSAINHYRKINDCGLFFQPGDPIKYIAVPNREGMYILHFELIMNCSYDATKPKALAQTLIGIVVDFPDGLKHGACHLWVKNWGSLLTLNPNLIHVDLIDFGDVLCYGDRILIEYKEDQIISAQLKDAKSRGRLENWIRFKENQNSRSKNGDRAREIPEEMNRFSSTESLIDSEKNLDLSTRSSSLMAVTRSGNSTVTTNTSFINRDQFEKAIMRVPNKSDSYGKQERVMEIEESVKKKFDVATLATLSVSDVECQTDPPTETSIVEEIMADAEIFKFIASKRLDLIRRWCTR